MDEKDKKEYELAVLVKQEEDIAPIVALVREHNGDIFVEPRTKKLALAYEIKKNNEAIFAYLGFTAAGEDAKKLEKTLQTKADVIRFLIIASPTSLMPVAEHSAMPAGGAPSRRPRMARPATSASESKPAASAPLSNEALEKKIEEILK